MKNELQRIRWEKDISVEKLARLSGISPSEISKIESNQASPTLDTMCRLAKALKMDIWQIWNC